MKSLTKLSLIVPTYNCAAYLSEALDSALSQTLRDVEVIVVDDGSTDDTDRILDQYRGADKLRIYRQENRGISAARNVGLAMARGTYVGLLDADDRWHPTKAARHFDFMEAHPELDLTYSWLQMIDDSGHLTGRYQRPGLLRPKYEDLLCRNLAGAASTVVFRRCVLGGANLFDTALASYEDIDLWLRIAAIRDGNIACIPEILTDYRTRSGQLTADLQGMQHAWIAVLEKARRCQPDRTAKVEATARGEHARYHAYIAYMGGDLVGARKLLREAWLAYPRSLLADRRGLVTTAAIISSYLPSGLHDRLAAMAKAFLWYGARG